jgi:hypothetical protein
VAAEGRAGVLEEAGVLDGRRADDDVAQAAVDVFFDGVQVADAAAELHRNLVPTSLRMALMAL